MSPALRRTIGSALLLLSWLRPAPALAQASFLRGNSNGDPKVDISDAVFTLSFLFLGGPAPACSDAADANDDGRIDISDAVFTLAHLFVGGPAPPPPGLSQPGPDPTADALACGPADTEPPEAAMNLATSPPSGANNNTPEITGTAEPGATVEVFAESRGEGAGGGAAIACAGTRVASGAVEPGGTFRIPVSVADDTSTAFSVRVIDVAGNVSTCSEVIVYVEDSSAPAPPTITATVPASPSSQRSPQVLGTAEPSANIAVFLDAACSGAPAAIGRANDAGAFSLVVTVPASSTAAITARAADAAGNESACSAPASYTHQPAAPATRLVISQVPVGAVAGQRFWAGVAAQDEGGNFDPAFGGLVTLAIGQGPAGAALSGTTSGNAQGGVFRQGDLSLDTAGTYTLTAASQGLTGAETAPFVVRPPSTPPSVASLTSTGNTGCVGLRYRLAHPQSQFADVRIEFSPDAETPFEPATPGGTEAVTHLRTAPQPGVIQRFTWNTSRDLAGSTSTARLRVTPFLESDGTPGTPFTIENVAIDWNHLNLQLGTQLASAGVSDIAAGDLNGDGRLDLASTNPSADTITVHFQDPLVTGFFSTTTQVATGDGPRAVRIADFDRDGKLDLIVALATAGAVQVLRNDGAGGFAATATGATGAAPTALEVGDVDGDGRLDAVTTNEGDGSVTVLRQNDTGGFLPPDTFGAGTERRDLVVADFNRDGALDLAIGNRSASSVSIFYQDPLNPGTYLPPEELPVDGKPVSIKSGDANDDGYLDLVVISDSTAGPELKVFLGRDGGFVAARDLPNGPGGPLKDAAIADFDGDLRDDIVGVGDGGLTILVQRPVQKPGDAPTFEDSSDSAIAPGVPLTRVIACDWSGDGVKDLVAASEAAGALYPYRSQPSICRGPISLGRLNPATGATSLATGHIDNDGRVDVAVGAGDTVQVHIGLGDGGLRFAAFFQEGEPTTDVLLSDVDSDADLDVLWFSPDSFFASIVNANSLSFAAPVVSHPGGVAAVAGQFTADSHVDLAIAGATELSILAGNGAGGFSVVSSTPAKLQSLAIGHFNGDGNLDIAGASPDTNAYLVFLGDGNGNVAPGVSLPAGADPGQVVVLDADQDGQDDIAGVNQGDGTVSVFTRRGDGTFEAAPGSPYAVGPAPRGIAAGDVDGDLVPDLAITDVVLRNVSFLFSRIIGFAAGDLYPPAQNDPVAIDLAHFDGDGRLDLVVAGDDKLVVQLKRAIDLRTATIDDQLTESRCAVGDLNGDSLTDFISVGPNSVEAKVLLADRLGSFTAAETFVVGSGVTSLSMGDVSSDSKLDIVVTRSPGDSFEVYIGNGLGGFTSSGVFTGGLADPSDCAVGDLNRDGDLDIVVANGGGNGVTSFRNNGDATFTLLDTTVTGDNPVSIVLVDFNLDAIVDVATANFDSNTVTVSAGDGSGRFVLLTTLLTSPGPTGVAAGEVHRDGRTDLAVAHSPNAAGHSITFFPGADPAGTFGPGVGLGTETITQDLIFSGQDIVGFNGKTLSIHKHTAGNFFGLPQLHVLPITVAGAPAFADPEDARRIQDRSELGFCAVGRFEHLGGPAIQRLASLLTILLPLVGLALLGRRERRKRR
jgi:hypothetical protein